jgi:glycosyltransferase involved in cell wall biosynthesis
MNIIQVCPRYFPDIGGVETHVQEISERLVRQGHQVEVVCTDPRGVHPKLEYINGVRVRRFRSFAPNDAYFFAPQMVFYIKNCDAHILHAHGYHAFPALFAAMAAQGKKFIFTPHYHGRGHTRFRNVLLMGYDRIAKRIFYQADRIICDSEYEKNLVTKKFPVQKDKLVWIPIGINFHEFSAFNATRDPHRLLYIGRIEKYKGIHYIIEALPTLEEYSLVIVGKGPYEKDLNDLAQTLDVQHKITWKKDLSREDLIREYKSAGIFISLSSFEAYGITVAEALVSGLPVIVNRNGALKEFVDGEACIGIEPSAERLMEAIRSLKTTTGYRKRILDWDEVVERIIQIYFEEKRDSLL